MAMNSDLGNGLALIFALAAVMVPFLMTRNNATHRD